MQQQYDYIIVGGGSAGCVIATRLIENTGASVLLLEAGPMDSDPFIHMPAGLPTAIQKHSWDYRSEADPKTGVPEIPVPQGKVLGGGSSINGMVYVRGSAKDYDDWASVYGCTGWSYQDVLPYFLRAEGNESLGLPAHGNEGPLTVTECRYRHPLTMAYIRAGQELGYPYLLDMSGMAETSGVGFWQRTIGEGQRANTSRVYLSTVMDDKRLTLKTQATVEKVLIKDGKAIGVRYAVRGGHAEDAFASQEVVLSAGALATPKILMLSGIGPELHLRQFGIEVVAASPQVGKNFSDHLQVVIAAKTPGIRSMAREGAGLKKLINGAEWMVNHEGAVSSNIFEGGGFFDLDGDGRVETQATMMPAYDSEGVGGIGADTDGLTLRIGDVRPRSRGQVLLSGNSVDDPIRLLGNYLSDPADLESQVRATKFGMSFFDTPSMKRIVTEVKPVFSSDEEIKEYFKQYCCTQFHPTSTCRMGNNPAESVVDLQLRVWGVENLRIADASVMPYIPSGNTNAPTIMIAERAAEMIISGTP